MKHFSALYFTLDATTKTKAKVAAMVRYFKIAPAADAAWAVYFLSGRKPRQVVPVRQLAEWARALAGIPDWLFRECYDAVADLAETITLLLPEATQTDDRSLQYWVEERVLPLRGLDEAAQQVAISEAWRELDREQRFVFNKLITGAFRVGVSQKLTMRALAEVSGVERASMAHRLMGTWEPTPDFYTSLINPETTDADISRPYPFFLAYPVDDPRGELDDISHWQVEWKWDGIRGQIVRRKGETFIWSRGEELVTEAYPEVAEATIGLPDGTVLDGELLPWKDGSVLPFGQMQRRIGRKKVGKKILAEVPVIFLCYDMMELDGKDIRPESLEQRREQLEAVLKITADDRLSLSVLVTSARSWDDLDTLRQGSRERNVEGLMLKRRSSPYRVGRKRGDWWKWKVDPYTIDAVMLYAQRGSGKRAGLYTDYTFAVWTDDTRQELVPFAKAYSGLTDDEIRKVDAWVRRNMVERFGPVRSVKPELVFEIAFEGIRTSSRHKSGVAVRFPRILRWRKDKPAAEADTLQTIKVLLHDNLPADS